ncbi:MAG: BamA/TamA family outer membrane protein [Ferruginibacter sp.]
MSNYGFSKYRNYISLVLLVWLFSCTIPRKYQKNKPFVFNNKIVLKGGAFTREERITTRQRLYAQLEDSMRTQVKDIFFLIHLINHPPLFDTANAAQSARNMQYSLLHQQGYYHSVVHWKADTSKHNNGKEQRVTVTYTIDAGNPTLIDTFSYHLKNADLQNLTLVNAQDAVLKKGKPVTKPDVLGEISRLVELYRNNGYYKFTTEDIKMRGDTSLSVLTNVSDDPFENLAQISEANASRNKPTMKLALFQNPSADSLRLIQYRINNIYLYPDFQPEDALKINSDLTEETTDGFIIRFHKKLVRNSFLKRNIFFRKGDLYQQDNFNRTISSFNKMGVWQNVSIQIEERKDSVGLIDLIIQLLPAKKFGFEANVEASYSTNNSINNASAANSGSLLGLSGNLSLQNRNIGMQGIKMTHALRAGVELNLASQVGRNRRINSNEFSYTNTISYSRLIGIGKWINAGKKPLSKQTFININPTYTRRIDLYNMLSSAFTLGNEWTYKANRKNVLRFPNIEYSYLFNQSDSFKVTLQNNPFLRYSFNTALVLGSSYSYSSSFTNRKHPNRQHSVKWNLEESGLIWGRFGIFKKDLRQFIKTDIEYTYTTSRPKSVIAFRVFGGIGVPLDKNDTASLPFFKQYFAGGPNSMRGWPVRGIGRGSQPLAPYDTRTLNDRTGDIRFETNLEYRYNIAQIIPNSLTLKGAFFMDIGNVWNFNNSRVGGGEDSLQFNFKNFYRQLGVSAGTGFRFDFNYIILRLDLGFRFKRPEISENAGWKAPSIGFNDMFRKLFTRGENDIYRKWRYENFNFTIGLNYPF